MPSILMALQPHTMGNSNAMLHLYGSLQFQHVSRALQHETHGVPATMKGKVSSPIPITGSTYYKLSHYTFPSVYLHTPPRSLKGQPSWVPQCQQWGQDMGGKLRQAMGRTGKVGECGSSGNGARQIYPFF